MNTRDNDPLHAPINAKLSAIVAFSPSKPSWYEDWMQLGPETSELERLRVYQAIRNAGDLPDDAGFYLVSWQIDAITSFLAEDVLGELDEQMEIIQEQHGLEEGEFWDEEDIPPEYKQLMQKQQEAWDARFAEKLVEFGEDEMAELFHAERKRFGQRSEAGRTYFHGESSDSPTWLEDLVEHVGMNMEADSVQGPLGYRYGEEAGFWEVIIYPTPVELVGGAVDGDEVHRRLRFDRRIDQPRAAAPPLKQLLLNRRRLPLQVAEVKQAFLLHVVEAAERDLGQSLGHTFQRAAVQEGLASDMRDQVVTVTPALGHETAQRQFTHLARKRFAVRLDRLEAAQLQGHRLAPRSLLHRIAADRFQVIGQARRQAQGFQLLLMSFLQPEKPLGKAQGVVSFSP
jgi:hypothetical protein